MSAGTEPLPSPAGPGEEPANVTPDAVGLLPAAHVARVEASRRELLLAVGDAADLTFVRGVGNLGGELIHAGVRRLLAGRAHREIGLDEVAHHAGDTALLTGGGAWCRPCRELMPKVLALLELRFRRVVVLPSSFDVAVEEVRDALAKSRAVVFARERESFRQIRGLCAARLALDCSFFFDFSPYRKRGAGVLDAFRTDRESSRAFALPAANLDISLACRSLAEWVGTIAGSAQVQTDQAHVMIAAALLGKEVRVRPSSDHQVTAIADYVLADFDVRVEPAAKEARVGRGLGPARAVLRESELAALRGRLAQAGEETLALLPAGARAAEGAPRVTLVVLSWDRLEATENALRSIALQVRIPYRLLLVDNNSDAAVRRALASAADRHPFLERIQLDRNLGCAGGRQRAVEQVATEYVMFLDGDAEVFPGTVEHLVHRLDREPEALAAGCQVVLPDGTVQFCGGGYEEEGDLLRFTPSGRGLPFGDPPWRGASPCRWLPGAGALFRTAVFADHPLDTDLAYYEDNEWCYRVERAVPGRLRRVPESLVLHHQESKERRGSALAQLIATLPFLEAAACVWRRHGRILDGFFGFVPELCGADGPDLAAARLWLDLLSAWGSDRLLLAWLAGDLRPILSGDRERELAVVRAELDSERAAVARLEGDLEAIHASRLWRLADLYWSLRRALHLGGRTSP